ncbi:hypothetical protein DFH07DRAFT_774137 [Mycena maculata]|uniref:HMG domain-containing protein n=1 Tax=Mycena maculata TaxID=230809 RepID=A0AAD7NBZ2_9AGAR|nr:hypothetical protein DFH07DRAFT_774137 [Mycena maculata]
MAGASFGDTGAHSGDSISSESNPMPVPGTQKIDTSIFGSLGYEEYTEAILQEGGSFYQIGRDLFVVNGWDDRTKQSKTSWYHLQRTVIGVDIVIVCRCPLATPDNPCVHERFLSEYGDEMFPADEEFTADRAADVVLFSRQETAEGYYLNYFSCPSSNSRSLNSRTVVTYDGDDGGAGNWSCKKDSDTQSCYHINRCRDMLQKLVLTDPSAKDSGIGDGCSIDYAVPNTRRGTQDAKAVSYLPISPPTWAALPTDPVLYERRLPLHDPPSIIPLTETSSCCCSQPRVLFSPAASTRQQTCMIYGLYGYLKTSIEVQTCSHCSHRLIGPDGRELGLFNHNNQRLFTHDLLDEYTSAYTSSETPFVAWVTVVSRRYEVHSGGAQQFVSDEIFRAAWFSYVRLQFLEGDMTCPRCGPSPDNTIWDGPSSVERQNTRYLPAQQLIDNRRLIKLILKVITGPPLVISDDEANPRRAPTHEPEEEEEEDEEDEEDTELTAASGGARSRKEGARIRARKEMLERLEAIPLAVAGLSHIDEALGSLFDTHFGEVSVVRRIVAPNVYHRFFAQVYSRT